MTSIEESVCRSTIKAVKDKTDWYRRGWQWMVCSQRADRDRLFQPDAFYLAEFFGKRIQLSLNDVCEKDEFTTEDGRYLIAYKQRRGTRLRRVSSSLLALLKQKGVIKTVKDLRRDQRLSHAHRDALDSILSVSRV